MTEVSGRISLNLRGLFAMPYSKARWGRVRGTLSSLFSITIYCFSQSRFVPVPVYVYISNSFFPLLFNYCSFTVSPLPLTTYIYERIPKNLTLDFATEMNLRVYSRSFKNLLRTRHQRPPALYFHQSRHKI